MSHQKALIAVAYLLVLTGIGAAYLSELVSPLILLSVVLLWFLSLIIRCSSINIRLPELKRLPPTPIKGIIATLIVLYFFFNVVFFSESLLTTSMSLLLIVQVIKLFSLKKAKDILQMKVICFLEILSAASTTISLLFLPLFITYFVLTLWWFVIFHLTEEDTTLQTLSRERTAPAIKSGEILETPPLTPTFFFATGVVSILSLLLTLTFFFTIPRIGIGFFQRDYTPGIRVSGFSEDVDLGEIGRIKLDPTVVMRVELPDFTSPPSIPIYWRGKAFDYFDGFQWKDTIGAISQFQPEKGIFKVAESEARLLVKQRILLEPLSTNVLFTLPYGVKVIGDFPYLRVDSNGAIYLLAPPFKRIEYTVYSSPSAQKRGYYPSPAYLKLPEGVKRIKTLAEEITKGIEKAEDKAVMIDSYLKANFRYNLDAKWDTKRPLDSFLFDVKEGYCEQFATAMAILLRSVGVPTRLVTGFMAGEWNRYGNYFLVRQKDAHSWVEVYIEGAGWVTFDPTPAVEVPLLDYRPPSSLTLFIDSLRLKWDRYILRYSLDDQKRVVKKAREMTLNLRVVFKRFASMSLKALSRERLKEGINSFDVREHPLLITIPLIVILLTLSNLTVRYLRMERNLRERLCKKKGIKGDELEVVKLYLYMLRLLERRGFKKADSMTPWEFANSIKTFASEEASQISLVTDTYYRVRFGGLTLNDSKIKEIKELLKTLK